MYSCPSRLKLKTILAIALTLIATPVQAAKLSDINETFLQSIRHTGVGTPEVARTGAIVYLSVYDAINGIDLANNPNQGFQQYFTAPMAAPTNASREAAAVAAAQEVLESLYPQDNAFLSSSFSNLLSTIPDSSAKSAGISWGESVAQQLLAVRSSDGANVNDPYIPINNIGVFDGSWGSQQYRNLSPFSVGIDLSTFSVSAPPRGNAS